MPIDAVDAQVASIVSDAQLAYQKQEIGNDGQDAQIQKQIELKAEIKREDIKSTDTHEVFERQDQIAKDFRQIMQGAAGPDAARALNACNQQNGDLQRS